MIMMAKLESLKIKKRCELLLTEEQENKLEERAEALGFAKKSDYIRFVLFIEPNLLEKLTDLNKQTIFEDARKN